MTGFGAAEGQVGRARVAIELRSVNHRFFNPTIKLPSLFARWEGEVREALRQRVSRGHVTLFARVDRQAVAGTLIDEEKFAANVAQLRELQARYGLGGEVDLATVLRMPDIFAGSETSDDPGTVAELIAVVNEAAGALSSMRQEEGARLETYLRDRVNQIETALEVVGARAPQRLMEQRDRLREAVKVLTDGITADETRIAQEIAILADRLDVSEELDRFRSHVTAFRAALDGAGSDGVGKRLGFLLQEMLREANTTGSKANDAAMLQQVVLIKEELERIREQVENLE